MFERLESRQMMSAGDLDPTFGVGGKFIAPDTIGFPVADMAVQPDGKMVLVGSLNGNFAVTRLNANGTIDPTFGGGGFVRTDFGNLDEAHAVAIQPDGKIIVAGQRGFLSFADHANFAVARYNPNGSLDKTFAADGKRTIDFGQFSVANALALQPDGKILVAGTADTGLISINRDFAVARLMPDGTLDRSFGDRSLNPLNHLQRTGKTNIGFGNDEEAANAITVAPDGKILVGGLGNSDLASNPLKFEIARLKTDGTLDKNFGNTVVGGNGRFSFPAPQGAHFGDLVGLADGSVIFVGETFNNFLTMKLNRAGALEQSFGENGRVQTLLGGVADAKHVRVNPEGILVAGSVGGKFAMVRYRRNGEVDRSFGDHGRVITPMGADDAILTTKVTADGKLLAFGRSGSVARYIQAVPKVSVLSLDAKGAEAGNNPASLIFQRDHASNFPTRVFFDLSGTATFGTDYTGPTTTFIATDGVTPPSGSLTPVTLTRVGFVDIPANETIAVVPINVIDDKALEPAETIRAAIRSSPAYTLGDRTTQQVDIADNDIARVNFQVTPTPFAFAYEPDLGLPFGIRPNGQQFGWDVDNRANARDRGAAAAPGMSIIYTTFNHMQKPGGRSKWEMALPNGMYEVKLGAGDPLGTDSVYRMNLEGQLALAGTPGGAVRWFERTVRVAVSDGRLTLSNAAGAVNNKIAFIEIKGAAPGAQAGPVTPNLPVSLPKAKRAVSRIAKDEGIFSQIAI
jgi:uncharacterized delta-60 repeat protein